MLDNDAMGDGIFPIGCWLPPLIILIILYQVRTSSACPNEPVRSTTRHNETLNQTATPPAAAVDEKPSTGNCTNNLTDPSAITQQTLPPETEPAEAEPSKQPIVTFDEWTKEKLKQEQRKASPTAATPTPVASPPTPTRNYASRECGAKILMNNPEAENTKAILNDKEKDEYMRNPCVKADGKYFVLELCETIQPQQLVLGNFELFSSGPKDIRVSASERSGSDWQSLGNFTAADTRQLQTFNIESRQYAKLLKIELMSHYGNEHYCTLSVLKIMGSSMVDEYEYEAHLANQAEVRLPVEEPLTTAAPPPVQVKSPPVEAEAPKTTATEPPSPTLPPVPAEPVATMAMPKTEQKPIVREIVDQGGKILKGIVTVVKNKLTGDKKVEKRRKYKPFDVSLCKVCPNSPSCIVPTHLCWVFVWRPPPKNSTIPTDSLALPARRMFSEKQRRRRIAFHQRQLHEKRHFVVPIAVPEQMEPVAETVAEPKPEEVLTTTVPPVVQAAPPTTDALPAASVSHKESVFMKLNKRIAALELNMSLSSEYLSELSRQYVAQTDMHLKHMDQAKKTAQEVADVVEARLNQTIAERLMSMRQEMDSLASWLHNMRLTATELSISRFIWQEKDKCRSEDITAMRHFIADGKSSLWTLDEVVIYIAASQAVTILIFSAVICYICSRRNGGVSVAEVEQLIQAKMEQMMEKKTVSPAPEVVQVPPPPLNAQKKKRRRRNRPAAGHEYPSSDSAVSQTTACPTETSSEAESARLQAQQLLDTTLRPPSPPTPAAAAQERSEEEDARPWVPVKRKSSN